MRFCIYGAGAIGGYLAVELALSGQEVYVVARGAHLDAIRERGLTLKIHGEEKVARVRADSDPRVFGPVDVVICALKAHQAFESAATMAPLLGPDTCVVTAMNGIPWWYFYKTGGRSERLQALSNALTAAAFDAPVRDNIRWNIWLKLWGSVCFNPISALTGATLGRMIGDPDLRALCRTMMLETQAVNEALDAHIPADMMDRRLAGAASATDHKMSMLQDLERGRSLEIDALVGVVQELGRLTSVGTPVIDAVLALVKERARASGLYSELTSL